MQLQIDKSKPVLVTGANGYVAGWVIQRLLDEGVTVHATVRDTKDPAKTEALQKMADARDGTIHFFGADLLKEGSFDKAAAGCGIVFHVASPYVLDAKGDPQSTFVDPAVKGTMNVLNAANRAESVERVVLTSSCAAIFGDTIDSKNDRGGLSEADWNVSSTIDHIPYSYSKTLAEKTAWDMEKAQDRWRLVVVNPSYVFGPAATTKTQSATYELLDRLVSGDMRFGAPRFGIPAVDVRDVADAHIRAAFLPDAEGRHIVSGHNSDFVEMGQLLSKRYGDRFKLPARALPKWLLWLVGPFAGMSRDFVTRNVNIPIALENSKSKSALGMVYRPLEETLNDMLQDGIENGHYRKAG